VAIVTDGSNQGELAMKSEDGISSNGAKILIVEDSPTQAQLLRDLLDGQGYQSMVASCGKEALEFLEDHEPDLIFTDVVMPEMDGYELTRTIKESEALSHIPVIMLTSLSDPEDVVRALDAGLDFYLTKPFDQQHLLSKVESVLGSPSVKRDGEIRQAVEVAIGGKTHEVRLSPGHFLNLLVSTYENAVWMNDKLLRTQLELRSLNHDLENKVTELGDFSYAVSHDLKAPLRAVSQLASWIASDQREALDDNGKEMLNLLLTRLDRMHNLIEGILSYARIGRSSEDETLLDLNVLVSEIIDMLAPPETFEVTIEGQLPEITFQRTLAIQVFQNLISNSIKYMDKPDGVITIACEDMDSFWRFSVEDNGPGIDKKYHEKIFGMFQTLTARDEYESTGIGLSLVKKIVDLSDGTIWVDSAEGEGTAFFFTLPKPENA
jgi:signal transduction histidine kinase